MRDEQNDPDIARRIQNAIDMLPSPIFIKDEDCRYIACNRAFESYIGLPRARIIGATVYDVAPPELAAIYEKADRDLLADGGTQTYETNVRYADGSVHDVIFYKSVFHKADGRPDGISGVILDITERKRLEDELAQAAREDFLTGAVNLRTFYELADQEFARFKRTGEAFSLLVLDLDHFKKINDTLGHEGGDDALRKFVQIVTANLREQDIFARAGGDEFRLLLPGTPPSGAIVLAEKIREEVSRVSLRASNGSVPLSMSAGLCRCHPDDTRIDDVVRRADAALYEAKAAGRNAVRAHSGST
ncbi:diguanylate cyclase [Sulfuriferula sp. GW1]|uniref:sensor domain-containing diguanylate cyclase n=1 Tax=Sulfuriferula sp. GW1 TaxID=3345111 RepID=UPI0039B00FBC